MELSEFVKIFEEFDVFLPIDYFPQKKDPACVYLYENYAHVIIMIDDWFKPYEHLKCECSDYWELVYVPKERQNFPEDKENMGDRLQGILYYEDAEYLLNSLGYEKVFSDTSSTIHVDLDGYMYTGFAIYGEKWINKSGNKFPVKNIESIQNVKVTTNYLR